MIYHERMSRIKPIATLGVPFLTFIFYYCFFWQRNFLPVIIWALSSEASVADKQR